MADIAMLVAEEYEKRAKHPRKKGGGSQEIDGSTRIKNNYGEGKTEILRRFVEPTTRIGLAAVDGFFSA
ncbi:hypothetical protein NMG60_11007255 [Bertholletia excelsa]